MEDSAKKIEPDPVLLPQVVPQLANLPVHLKHGGNVLLRLCGCRCVQLLHLVRPLHRQKTILGHRVGFAIDTMRYLVSCWIGRQEACDHAKVQGQAHIWEP